MDKHLNFENGYCNNILKRFVFVYTDIGLKIELDFYFSSLYDMNSKVFATLTLDIIFIYSLKDP